MKIFVQIASYRDPELVPTIKDCIENAKYPEDLTFGICWQRDESEDLSEYQNDPRFRILEYNWKESKGLCWARHLIQKLYRGEEYTLQLDSHHRFAKNWDEKLIKMMELTGSEKPILTSYAGMYNPEGNKKLNIDPYKVIMDKFTPEGTILFRPWGINNYEELKKPIPARVVSGHFFFTIGRHCEDYKYDPNLYFAGDEISLSIRSYTLGYDLFHPHETVVWHEYTRKYRTKHWSDHNKGLVKKGQTDLAWHERDVISKKRLRHMLREENENVNLGEYDVGDKRSHHEYELYAGVDFANKVIHERAKTGEDPVIVSEEQWVKDSQQAIKAQDLDKEWPIHAQWDINKIPDDNYKFWYFGVEDQHEKILFRKDFNPEDDPYIISKKINNFTTVIKSRRKPKKWVLWVYSNTRGGWAERIEKDINVAEFR
jgi:hypothetical protein